ncbi:hypothetical protein IM793_23175 [Pedobacter sp. MR2016-19]|uniref:Uncharacterized protein n=1 Tax=Pedobacter alluvionis TaxID=475253 RepID=A0A497YBG8_9SPHI|nr:MULTISPECIES: hypothetical protein [Pedobacter]MBE5322076.1 hypothetical protein [Pedobacter sp. MR2016-19]RLJ80545.1 hypothetical protein BCL90_1327 [Pedobacter alluvionis]TFB31813.1 hypothetical protein E3V97_14635 [Pedobacter alluvionis]
MANNDQKAQAKVFLYELNNTRHEYGFSADEEWTLDLATDSQRKVLEHKYYPMLSLTVVPENIIGMLDLLEDKLGNAVGHIKDSLSRKKISKESTHLLAYCIARLKH